MEEEEAGDEYESTGNEVLDQILTHPTTQGLFERIGTLIDRAGNALERGIGAAGRPAQGTRPRSGPAPASPREDPREVLGFGPNVVLTVRLVKERRKRFAELCHPDAGGSTQAMARINAAADALLTTLNKRKPPSQ